MALLRHYNTMVVDEQSDTAFGTVRCCGFGNKKVVRLNQKRVTESGTRPIFSSPPRAIHY